MAQNCVNAPLKLSRPSYLSEIHPSDGTTLRPEAYRRSWQNAMYNNKSFANPEESQAASAFKIGERTSTFSIVTDINHCQPFEPDPSDTIVEVVHMDFKNEIPEKAIDVGVRPASASIFSDTSTTTTLLDAPNFHAGTMFHVAQRGIGACRLPTPSSELVTQIFHEDGSVAYTSTRAKRSSGNAVLSHPKLGDLCSTTYSWGPGRPPVLKLLEGQDGSDTVNINGKWFSRTTGFTTPDGRLFEWSYASMKDPNGKRVNIIALREKDSKYVLAQLIRGEGTRTEGTSRCTAGNGGQLVLDQEATSHVDEVLIIATCLVMLKKEIDRRRGAQAAVIAGAVS
ncbi:hypothetical protein H2200_013458 [Cladophialophora chaetospira]|uniref:Uncharacterized protein n=1 Tax=Cladophialophora chaetospira TaxID=386627 RepID=A0AA38UEC5_9EURO|nr:hypothetical protein H2200_013458 [Cladophialophora chaetospira]